MLGEAHRRLERGTDLVAAVVETHGRKKTAELIDGHRGHPAALHRVPRQAVPRARRRRRAAAAARRWSSSTNSRTPTRPGSKNPKRWQDVEELLDAGITVISTVNVQHLESLNDVVTQITGIEQQEKVPDEVVRAADQIELVDITPEALRRRLAHGNVYAPERVDAALSNYFRRGNLTALRELALLWLADQVDAALEKYREENQITDTWEARERVVVAVTGGPESETLVRRASRIASKSSAELMVVHVVRGDGLSGVSAPQMGKVRELAISLGATLHTVVGDDVPTALLDFARDEERHPAGDRHVPAVAVGAHLRRGHRRRGRAAVRQDRRAHGHPRASQAGARSWSRISPRQHHAMSWLAAVVVPSAICAVIVYLLDPYLGIGGESALFFIGVLVVALLGGVAPAALSAVLSGLLLNYFLVEPRYTFTIAEPDSAVTDRGAACSSRWRSPRWSTARPAAPGRPGARRRRPNCSRCSPDRCCAAPTWTRCWSGCAKPIHSAPSACCGRRRRQGSRRVRGHGSLRRRRHRRHRDRGRRRRVLDADGRAQAARPRPPGARARSRNRRRAWSSSAN